MATVFAGLASAQALTCVPGTIPGGAAPAGTTATSLPNNTGEYGPSAKPGPGILPTQPIELRSEGATELVSDVIFVCDGATASLQGEVTAYMGGNVPGLAVTSTLPILQILDNTGAEITPAYYQGTVVGDEVIFGIQAVGAQVYGNTGPVVFPGKSFIIRISNIRVNVTGLLNPTAPTPVTETVFAGAQGVATLFQSSAEVVGYVLKSLNVSLTSVTGNPANYVVCQSNASSANPAPSFSITVSELFAGAFKAPNTPTAPASITSPDGFIPGGEQGTFTAVGGIESNPLGTRIKFVVANIPAGVTALSVPNSINPYDNSTTLVLDLVTGGNPPDIGTAGTFDAAGSTSLPVSNGTVTVIYQVDADDLTIIKSFVFSPDFVFAANAIVGSQPAATVTTSYAPSPAAPGGAIVVPTTYLPYFANTGVPLKATIWSVCETDLLFPFITTQNGFETGIAISNTASDPFGTTGQPGVCNLYFYGTGQAPAATSPVTPTATAMTSIAIGTTQDTVVSPYLGSNYLGYVIARCQFLYAHGFAFFTNAAPGITAAQQAGYTALVFTAPPATMPRSGTPLSEALDQ
jgi:hypothetical protein